MPARPDMRMRIDRLLDRADAWILSPKMDDDYTGEPTQWERYLATQLRVVSFADVAKLAALTSQDPPRFMRQLAVAALVENARVGGRWLAESSTHEP